jgi:hypothetical protein
MMQARYTIMIKLFHQYSIKIVLSDAKKVSFQPENFSSLVIATEAKSFNSLLDNLDLKIEIKKVFISKFIKNL